MQALINYVQICINNKQEKTNMNQELAIELYRKVYLIRKLELHQRYFSI